MTLAYISEFTTYIWHVEDEDNPVTDTLSGAKIESIHEGMVYEAMAAKQKKNPDIQVHRTAISGLRLEDIPIRNKGITILCDTSTGQPRLMVPTKWRERVFDVIYGLPHLSIHSTRKLIASKLVWHGLNKQVGIWAKVCILCQISELCCIPWRCLFAILTTFMLTL